ncbi:MAG: hypothetical protein M1338_00015 [Patescibacteria group bacterium]|nr:hypothetical protein [Patescibacteria group bacterium]
MGTSGSKPKQIIPVETKVEAKHEQNVWVTAVETDIKMIIDSFPETGENWNKVIVKKWDSEDIPPPSIYDMCYISTKYFAHASEIMMSSGQDFTKLDWFLWGLRWGRARACTGYYLPTISPDIASVILKRVCKAKNIQVFGVSELVSEFPHPIAIQPKT